MKDRLKYRKNTSDILDVGAGVVEILKNENWHAKEHRKDGCTALTVAYHQTDNRLILGYWHPLRIKRSTRNRAISSTTDMSYCPTSRIENLLIAENCYEQECSGAWGYVGFIGGVDHLGVPRIECKIEEEPAGEGHLSGLGILLPPRALRRNLMDNSIQPKHILKALQNGGKKGDRD